MSVNSSGFGPRAPIFISYRHSDGTEVVDELAGLLRAAGLPVWRDKDDLLPGDTETRLAEAMAKGLSGAVFVITPDIQRSEIVKFVEVPKLLEMHANNPGFVLGILNDMTGPGGDVDYAAPDRLLGRRPGTLKSVDQQPATGDGLGRLVRGLARHRVALRDGVAGHPRTLTLSIQTRNVPQSGDHTNCDLDVRIRPRAEGKTPSPAGLHDLSRVIGILPDAASGFGAERVTIEGGAHLSVALAMGAAFPSTRVRLLEVTQGGQVWASGPEAHLPDPAPVVVIREGANPTRDLTRRPAVALFVDMMSPRSDAAFDRFLEEHGDAISAWRHLGSVGGGRLDPAQAGVIASAIAAHLRELSGAHANGEVHLMMRGPFPLAVLVGRLTNTLRVVAYEWDDPDPGDADHRPRYLPSLELQASAGSGVIKRVLLSK